MREDPLLTRRQLTLLCWAALLSPLARQTPLATVRRALQGAWISALLSFFPLLLMAALLCSLLRQCAEGEGLGELFLHTLGRPLGTLALGLATAWLLFYAAFVLRAGADRFIATVYPDAAPLPFVLLMTGLGLMAGLGRLKVLGRFAEVAAPAFIGLFLLLFPAILPQLRWEELGGVTSAELPGVLRGVLPAADTLALAALGAFAEGETEGHPRLRGLVLPLLGTVGLVTALCAATVGVFGAALTTHTNYPFFVLLRNLRPLGYPERLETLLIAQWVVTDFLLYSLLLHICVRNLRLILPPAACSPRRCTAVCALLSCVGAFLCADSSFALMRLSSEVMPVGNAVLLFGIIPLVWIISLARKAKPFGPGGSHLSRRL